ncbi:hypothetical protein WJX75_008135 [Coccomyxa subellipsoidea]|uniref:S-adenosyl-L-methionine-dependent methyltransferase n=1 Tax=Coccomyxa subellipsoidea TaxID=248742 RepID=A0ABR2YS28_9CHLO
MLTEQTQQRLQLEIWQLQKPSEVLHLLRDIGRGRVDETAQHALIDCIKNPNLFEGSTGCHEWEAGFVLSEFIFSHTKLFKGRRCCELGCGPGVVGISLQRVGAGSILLTDGDSQTLLNCRHNLGINNVLVKDHDAASPSEAKGVKMAEIKWENGGSLDADVFLGADLLYDPGSHAALVQLIGSSLRRGGSVEPKQMILATTMRDVASVASFLRLITDAGLSAELLGDGDLQSLTVRFQRHLDLDKMRRSILLHRITANAQTVM